MLALIPSVHISTSVHTRIHVHIHTEPSLTLDILTSVLDGVQCLDGWSGVSPWLQIPDSKREELKRQYDRRQLPRAYSTIFLADHLSPSWSTVALALWVTGEHGALEVVQKLYLKGEPCAHSCRSEGRIGSLLHVATLFHPSDTVWLTNLKVVLVTYSSTLLILYSYIVTLLIIIILLCNCVHTSSLVVLVQ